MIKDHYNENTTILITWIILYEYIADVERV